jgi:hypothetical protein
MYFRIVIPSIIRDNNDFVARLTTCFSQLFKEGEKRFSIKFIISTTINKFAVAKSNSVEILYALASWRMKQNRIAFFRCYPHTTARAMLLEMNFVDCPQIYAGFGHHVSEFFLCSFCRSGSAFAMSGSGLRNR